MNDFLMFGYGFATGAACVGGWWWWINHRAKARALVQTVENIAKGGQPPR